jgi:hypothetical protein
MPSASPPVSANFRLSTIVELARGPASTRGAWSLRISRKSTAMFGLRKSSRLFGPLDQDGSSQRARRQSVSGSLMPQGSKPA